MKTIWQLTYETIPGNGEKIKKYKSFAEAKKDIKEMISQIDIFPYTAALREEGIHKTYRAAMADFLDHYVSRKDFLSAHDVIPSQNSEDYKLEKKVTIKDDADEDVDYYDWYDEDEEVDELDDFDIYLDKDWLSFSCDYEGFPELKTDMVVMDDETKEYRFAFHIDRAPRNKLKELQMTLTPLQYWGTSSYPLLILRTLENSQEPLDQQRIILHIEAAYDTTIERKAIGRNITLLKDLGYDIQHNGEGYFISKKAPALEQEDFQTIVDSIKTNEALDDERKRELIDKLFEL